MIELLLGGEVTLLVLIALSLFQNYKLHKLLVPMKLRNVKHQNTLQTLSRDIDELKQLIEQQFNQLYVENTSPLNRPAPINDEIEQRYDRAKRIMSKSSSINADILKNCAMTEEEIELLSELLNKSPKLTSFDNRL